MISVKASVNAVERDGKTVAVGEYNESVIEVRSHWNVRRWVVLVIAGQSYTLDASELTQAIGACTRG